MKPIFTDFETELLWTTVEVAKQAADDAIAAAGTAGEDMYRANQLVAAAQQELDRATGEFHKHAAKRQRVAPDGRGQV